MKRGFKFISIFNFILIFNKTHIVRALIVTVLHIFFIPMIFLKLYGINLTSTVIWAAVNSNRPDVRHYTT